MTPLENGLELLLSHAGFILMLFALVAVALLGVLAEYVLPDESAFGDADHEDHPRRAPSRPAPDEPWRDGSSPRPHATDPRSRASFQNSSLGPRNGPRRFVAGSNPDGFPRPRLPQAGPSASSRRCAARRNRGTQPDLTQSLEPRAAARN